MEGGEESWRPRSREDVVLRKVGNEWLLFDPRHQRIHALNLSATLVWSHCTGEYTPEDIEEAVVLAYGTEEARPHVLTALEQFRDEDLLL